MKELTKVFKALSDETRLRTLGVLMEKECCVCEVMQALEISQSKASRALGALYDAGVLKLRKEGRWSLYSIDREGMDSQVASIIEAATRALKDNPDAVRDWERLKKAERMGPGCGYEGRCAA
jgi:ArsR family transcriptional regulator